MRIPDRPHPACSAALQCVYRTVRRPGTPSRQARTLGCDCGRHTARRTCRGWGDRTARLNDWRQGTHRRVAPHEPAHLVAQSNESPSMYEMEGPSPGLRGESCPISRAPFSPLGLHRTSDHLKCRLPDPSAANITSPRGFPRSSDLSSVAFRLGDVRFFTPAEHVPQGVQPTFSRFPKSPQLHPQNPSGCPPS